MVLPTNEDKKTERERERVSYKVEEAIYGFKQYNVHSDTREGGTVFLLATHCFTQSHPQVAVKQ